MANVLGLALKVNADATGLRLDPVERALQRLGTEAEKVGSVFTKFAASSASAAEEQARTATRFEQLANSLRAQEITAEQYAEAFAQIKAEAAATAAVFDRGAQTAAKFATEQENTAAALGKLAEELRLGAIEAPVFERALQSLSGVDFAGTEEGRQALAELAQQARDGTIDLDAATATLSALAAKQDEYTDAQSRAAALLKTLVTDEQERLASARELEQLRTAGLLTEQEYAALLQNLGPLTDEAREAESRLAADRSRAKQILEGLITPQEEYQNSVAELDRLLAQGLIRQEDYNRAIANAQQTLERTAGSAEKAALNFNELSGIFAILPGPLGNIAGRLSGLSSAGEGLSRVFSGGLSQGLSSITASFTNLLTPTNLAAAGIAAVGVAATQVVSGLVQLEDRVENLNRLASQLGVSFGFVQTLEEAGNRTGVSMQQLEGSFARLQNTLASGGEESKKATEALGRLGIAASELADLSQQEQIQLFGERIAAIEDPAQRSAAAIALFGRSGVQLLPFFNNLGQAATDVERFNARISDIDAQRINQLGDAFDGVNVALRGFGQELLTPFIGITRSIGEGLSPVITTLGQNLGALFDALSPITSGLGLLVNVVLQASATLSRVIGAVLEPFAASGRAISGVYDAVSQTFTVAFSAINRVVDSVRGFLQFSTPLAAIGNVFSGIATTISNTLAPVFERLSEIGTRVSAILTAAFDRLSSFFAAFANSFVQRVVQITTTLLEVTGISDTVTAVADAIGSAFGSAWDIIQGVAGTIGGLIERVLAFAEDWLGIVPTIEEPVEATIDVNTGDAIAELIAENKELGKLIDDISQGVSDAANQSVNFGQAGFDAALRFQTAIEELKAGLGKGLFNEATFKAEAERARTAFKTEIDRIEQENELDIKIREDAQKTLAGLNEAISKAIGEAEEFGDAGFAAALKFQQQVEPLREQFDRGIINETAIAQGVERANDLYKAQLDAIKKTRDEQEKLVEDDRKRIESLLETSDAAGKISQDLSVVQREITRLQQQAVDTAAGGDGTADARLRELEALQLKLTDQLEAAALGFENGFGEAFAKVGENLQELGAKAGEFGVAGDAAFQKLQEGIQAAQDQARDGILNKEAFDRQVEQQKQLFDKELDNIKKAADERKKINEFVDNTLFALRFGGDQQRGEAAQRAIEIEKEIIRVQGEVQAARKAGDEQARNAGILRLGQLDQVLAKEQFIASGRQKQEEDLIKAREEFLKKQNEQQQKFAEEQRKAAEAEARRQDDRIRELNTLGAGVIEGSDIRTSEGAALFLQLAANRQDPMLIEARLQTRRLTELRSAVTNLVEGLTGLPTVRIPGAIG